MVLSVFIDIVPLANAVFQGVISRPIKLGDPVPRETTGTSTSLTQWREKYVLNRIV